MEKRRLGKSDPYVNPAGLCCRLESRARRSADGRISRGRREAGYHAVRRLRQTWRKEIRTLNYEKKTVTAMAAVRMFYSSAMTSISHRAPAGSVFTATQLRAGLEVKYFSYTLLKTAKSAISARKHVVLMTWS